ILDDSRRHGIEILPLDVNLSEPEYTVELVTSTVSTYGIRLGLKDVHGISDAEVDSILQARAERAFTDVGDVLRRTALTRPVAEALAHAGAFDRLAPGRGSRRERLFLATVTDVPRGGEQMTLRLDQPHAGSGLREHTSADRGSAAREAVGMDA